MTTQFHESDVARDAGGKFAIQNKSEPAGLALLSTPSATRWADLVIHDSLSREVQRSFSRMAVTEALENDDFEVVFDAGQRQAVSEELDHNGHLDDAIDKLRQAAADNPGAWKPQTFGSELGRVLIAERNERAHLFAPGRPVIWTDPDGGNRQHARVLAYDPEEGTAELETEGGGYAEVPEHEMTGLARPSWHVPAQGDTFAEAEAFIEQSPEQYRSAMEKAFPHAPEQYLDTLMQNQATQPGGWQRTQLAKVAVVNEKIAAARADRALVGFGENPHFTSHPVTDLEEQIDALIRQGDDPTAEHNIDFLHAEAGQGYGTMNVKSFAKLRLDARRPGPHLINSI